MRKNIKRGWKIRRWWKWERVRNKGGDNVKEGVDNNVKMITLTVTMI